MQSRRKQFDWRESTRTTVYLKHGLRDCQAASENLGYIYRCCNAYLVTGATLSRLCAKFRRNFARIFACPELLNYSEFYRNTRSSTFSLKFNLELERLIRNFSFVSFDASYLFRTSVLDDVKRFRLFILGAKMGNFEGVAIQGALATSRRKFESTFESDLGRSRSNFFLVPRSLGRTYKLNLVRDKESKSIENITGNGIKESSVEYHIKKKKKKNETNKHNTASSRERVLREIHKKIHMSQEKLVKRI